MLMEQHFLEAKGLWYFIIMASLTFTAADKRKLGFGQQILPDALLSDLQSDWFVDWHSDSRNSTLWNAESFCCFYKGLPQHVQEGVSLFQEEHYLTRNKFVPKKLS